MSYAVRNDLQGFRAVSGPDDVGEGEHFCLVAPVIDVLPPTRERVEAARLHAYANPVTGSDRYFAEAQRESLLGNTEAAGAAKALGMARFAEIQADNPWPAE